MTFREDADTLTKLTSYRAMKLGTEAAKALRLQQLEYYIGFYEKLRLQLEASSTIV